jgi:hypothetical protein
MSERFQRALNRKCLKQCILIVRARIRRNIGVQNDYAQFLPPNPVKRRRSPATRPPAPDF